MINLYLANLGKYNEGQLVGEWISLPFTDNELESLLVKIKLGTFDSDGKYTDGFVENGSFYEEMAIHDYETDIHGLEIGEYSNIHKLNDIAEKLEELNSGGLKLLESIIEYESNDISEAIDNLNNYILYSEINNDYDLGYYYIEESGIYDLNKMGELAKFIDYESFGSDLGFKIDGIFTENGWLENVG